MYHVYVTQVLPVEFECKRRSIVNNNVEEAHNLWKQCGEEEKEEA